MANTIFEQTGGTYTQVGDYSEYQYLGNAAQKIFEATP